MTVIDPARGTDEAVWSAWHEPTRWPPLEIGELAGRRIVVLAAHPDDEALGVGGLLWLLAQTRSEVLVVWATDGEASHATASPADRAALGALRRAEARAATALLGLGAAPRVHLALPDSNLAEHEDALARALARLTRTRAMIIAPWAGDGHPDHEACGRAARRAGCAVLEYPIWAWHWGRPADARIPWHRAHRIDLPATAQRAKAAALRCFRSQIEPFGSFAGQGPVLPDGVLRHFRRPYEVLLP